HRVPPCRGHYTSADCGFILRLLATPPDESSYLFNDPAASEILALSLHDALPISSARADTPAWPGRPTEGRGPWSSRSSAWSWTRSEEHTSELQSLTNLACRLLLA